MNKTNPFFIIGGVFSILTAILHMAIIFGGFMLFRARENFEDFHFSNRRLCLFQPFTSSGGWG